MRSGIERTQHPAHGGLVVLLLTSMQLESDFPLTQDNPSCLL